MDFIAGVTSGILATLVILKAFSMVKTSVKNRREERKRQEEEARRPTPAKVRNPRKPKVAPIVPTETKE